MCWCDDCQNDEKDEFVEVADQDIEENYGYWTVTMNKLYLLTALKMFKTKHFTITIHI